MNFSTSLYQAIQEELESLDHDLIEVNGKRLKSSQCYYLEIDPLHLMLNINCPSLLQQKLNAILVKYFPGYEAGLLNDKQQK